MNKELQKKAAEAYRNISIISAGKVKSLVMLAEAAVKFLNNGLGNKDELKPNIIKAQNILVQLQMALNLEEGEVPRDLFVLYDYMFELLMEGGDEQIKSVISLLNRLLETFKEIQKKRP